MNKKIIIAIIVVLLIGVAAFAISNSNHSKGTYQSALMQVQWKIEETLSLTLKV